MKTISPLGRATGDHIFFFESYWKNGIVETGPRQRSGGQVTQHGGFSAVESYDGKFLYYVKFLVDGHAVDWRHRRANRR